MTATKRSRLSREDLDDEKLRPPAPTAGDEAEIGIQTPEVPDLANGPVGPEAMLGLQQSIGNSAVGDLLRRQRGGQPLPGKARHDMEASFGPGADFGQVQVHSGPEVDQATEALSAAAFTTGDDIYVRSDLPSFDDPLGRAVLGEELAHVAQGVGTGEVDRVTDPDETAERDAHAAGRAVAAGETAKVGAAPEAEGALARFDLGEDLKKLYDWATGGSDTEKQAEKTDLSDEEKARLSAGASAPLSGLLPQLNAQHAAALSGAPSAKALTAIAENAAGISNFIASFTGPPTVQPRIESAAQAVVDGHQAIIGAIDPVTATKASGGILSELSDQITALANPAQPGNTPAPANAPQPAAAPAATPATTAPADALTSAEADQLKFGAAAPLKSAAAQLQDEEPDLHAILGRLGGVPIMLRTFTKPAAVVPQLTVIARQVEGQVDRLLAISNGPLSAMDIAVSEWQKAIGILDGLTAESPAGGAPAQPAAAPAPGGDEDKKKPG
jgi:hypothetical protein